MDPTKTSPTSTKVPANTGTLPMTEPVLIALTEALSGIRFGTVTVIIQDGRVVQIDRTERKRMKSESGAHAGPGSDPATADMKK